MEDTFDSWTEPTTEGKSDIKVFTPTMEEFKDFNLYIKFMEYHGAHQFGIAKIIPPAEWRAQVAPGGYEHAMDLTIPFPIKQEIKGQKGKYTIVNIAQKPISVRAYREYAESPSHTTPPHQSEEDLERKYWQNLTFNSPTYGADVSGTVSDPNLSTWNINNLGSILNIIDTRIDGVNTAYLYFGMWKSTFTWHTEDMDLYSINFLHFGASKSWYAVPPALGNKLERLGQSSFPESFAECSAYFRHKMAMLSPIMLNTCAVKYNKMLQKEGQIIITFPYGYHSGYNHGFNCAESTNFASERWVEYGKNANECQCESRKDKVTIDMTPFVKKFQPDRFEAWMNNEERGRHPECEVGKYSKRPKPPAPAKDHNGAEGKEGGTTTTNGVKGAKKGKKGGAQAKKAKTTKESHPGVSDLNKIMSAEAERIRKELTSPPSHVPLLAHHAAMGDSEPVDTTDDWKPSTNGSRLGELAQTQPRTAPQNGRGKKRGSPKKGINGSATIPESVTALTSFSDSIANEGNVDLSPSAKKERGSDAVIAGIGSGALDSLLKIGANNGVSGPPTDYSRYMYTSDISAIRTGQIMRNLQGQADLFKDGRKKKGATKGKGSSVFPNQHLSSDYSQSTLYPQPGPISASGYAVPPSLARAMAPVVPGRALLDDFNEVPVSPSALGPLSGINPLAPAPATQFGKQMKKSIAQMSERPPLDAKLLSGPIRQRSWTAIGLSAPAVDAWAEWVARIVHRPKNDPLDQAYSLEDIIRYNVEESLRAPHCNICILFSAPDYLRGPRTEVVPERTVPNTPEAVYEVKQEKGSKNGDLRRQTAFSARHGLVDSTGASPLLVCQICKVCVHQVCYGVVAPYKPGEWTCMACQRKEVGRRHPRCDLCNIRGGALMKNGDDKWLHNVCVLALTELKYINVDRREPSAVEVNPMRMKMKRCCLCQQERIGLVQCKYKSCFRGFHTTCAMAEGLPFLTITRSGGGIVPGNQPPNEIEPIVAFCPHHKDKAYRKGFGIRGPIGAGTRVMLIDEEEVAKPKSKKRKRQNLDRLGVVQSVHLVPYACVLFTESKSISRDQPLDEVKVPNILLEGPPEMDSEMIVSWPDQDYDGIFKGLRRPIVYKVLLDSGDVIDKEEAEVLKEDDQRVIDALAS